jgi:hypothetical protein
VVQTTDAYSLQVYSHMFTDARSIAVTVVVGFLPSGVPHHCEPNGQSDLWRHGTRRRVGRNLFWRLESRDSKAGIFLGGNLFLVLRA